jgi:hypothetical protein
MRIKIFKLLGLVIAMAAVSVPTAYAQKNRRVVHPVRHPVARARLVRHPGHPIHPCAAGECGRS